MNLANKLHSTPAPLLAGVLFLSALHGTVTAEPEGRVANMQPGRSFDNGITEQRSKLGGEFNGVRYVTATRQDIYEDLGSTRLKAADLSINSLDLTKSTQPITEVRMYVDTGNAPIRIQQTSGTKVDLFLGSLKVPNARLATAQITSTDPRQHATISIGSVIAPKSVIPVKVTTTVRTTGVEIVSGPSGP